MKPAGIIILICWCSITTAQTPSKDTATLKTVTVTGKKSPVKPTLDGFIYNAENDMAIAAGNAIDLLRRIPLITIGMDGTPRIQGSTNVRVFIDGKPTDIYASSPAEALQQIPAESIARIEVITQPSARYDAEGTDAVINIITKKSLYDGLTGSVNAVLGNRTRQAGMYLKQRKGKLVASLEANWYKYLNPYANTLERRTGSDLLKQELNGKSKMNTYVVGSTLTWIMDSLNTITGGYRYRDVTSKANHTQDTWYNLHDSVLDYSRIIETGYGNTVHTFNAGYSSMSRNKRREVNLLSTMFFHSGDEWYSLNQVDDELVNLRETNDGKISNREWAVQADGMQMIGKSSKLEVGFKISNRESSSNNEIKVFEKYDDARSNRFQYNRLIAAGYISYLLNIHSWTIRAGLRYEQARLSARFKDLPLQVPDFNNWLPNILVSKQFNDKHTVKASYSQKIVRPWLYALNPTIQYVDSLNIEYGNPNLEPELIHSTQLGYTFNKGKWLTGFNLLYDYRTKTILPVRFVEKGIGQRTFRNMDANPSYGATINVSLQKARGFSGAAAFTLQHYTVTNEALKNQGWALNGNARIQYVFKNDWQCEGSIHLESRSIYLQGIRSGWIYYAIIVNKKWWNDKLQASITIDYFLLRVQYRKEVLRTETFNQTLKNKYPVGFGWIGIAYRFGKKEIKEPVKKQIEGE